MKFRVKHNADFFFTLDENPEDGELDLHFEFEGEEFLVLSISKNGVQLYAFSDLETPFDLDEDGYIVVSR